MPEGGNWISARIARPVEIPVVVYPIQDDVRSRQASDKGDDEEPVGMSKSHAAHPDVGNRGHCHA